jgi:hypothetical protein
MAAEPFHGFLFCRTTSATATDGNMAMHEVMQSLSADGAILIDRDRPEKEPRAQWGRLARISLKPRTKEARPIDINASMQERSTNIKHKQTTTKQKQTQKQTTNQEVKNKQLTHKQTKTTVEQHNLLGPLWQKGAP